MEIEAARRRAPGGAGPGPGRRRSPASTRPRPTRSSPPPASPADVARAGRRRSCSSCGTVFVERGRHPGRGQPAGARRRRARSSPSTARSRSTRTPSFRHPDHAALADKSADGPAGGRGQGEGPQLRQARRRGRHHRQRRRPGDEHAGRRRLRRARSSAASKPGELPRHRRRRLGRGDGQRPGDHPRRPGGARACSSTSSAASPPATRSPTASCRPSSCSAARASTSTKPLVVRLDGNNADEGRRILDRRRATRASSRWTRWTVPRRRAAELALRR